MQKIERSELAKSMIAGGCCKTDKPVVTPTEATPTNVAVPKG